MTNVLFVCVQNAGRSQMSRAFFASSSKDQPLQSRSAGTHPAAEIDPTVVEVMAEVGHDLARLTPAPFTPDLGNWADVVVTMGCGDSCPWVPGTEYVDWELDDPAGRPIGEVREIRDEIRRRVDTLIADLADRGYPARADPHR